MYFSSRRRNEEHAALQDSVAYPEATVKEYLSMRRTTKDKCCLVTFCLYALAVGIIIGVAFIYGNSSNIGTFVSNTGPCNSSYPYLEQNLSTCINTCPSPNVLYLQKICVSSSYNPYQSQSLASQIQIYNLSSALSPMLYINIAIIIGVILLFILLICIPKLVYFYIFIAFLLLLGFSFYILKSIDRRIQAQSIPANTIFYQDEYKMTQLSFTLLAAYLVLFPILLFSPRKIKIAVQILSKMKTYFKKMYTVVILTCIMAILIQIALFLLALLLMVMYTAGSSSIDPSSFFYLYNTKQLSNPATLAFFFIGIYWIFATIISWHKYLISSSVCLWYFQNGLKLKPIRRSLKRTLMQFGSAAADAILTPIQWIVLFIYSLTKMNTQTIDKYQNQHPEDCLCFSNSLYRFLYCKINRNAPVTGILTNHNFFESCEIGAVTFAYNKHRFFNIGGNITLFLTLFSTLMWLFINYLALYYNIFSTSYPPQVSSIGLAVMLSGFIGLLVGQVMSNIFTVSVDCLLFCFLMQKKNGEEVSVNEIKKVIEEIYIEEQEEEEVVDMYEIEQEQD